MNFAILAAGFQGGGIFAALMPIILLIGLGAWLARLRLLGGTFIADLNKLAFWVALPALVFYSSAKAAAPTGRALTIFAVLATGTLAVCAIAYLVAALLKIPRASIGTFVQAAFRGNLALVGLPVLSFSLGKELLPLAAVVMTAMMILFNFLAVFVLQAGQRAVSPWLSLVRNPLIIAGILGLGWGGLHLPLPIFLERTLNSLASAAVPIALLCIGGGLALRPIRAGKLAFAAAILKVAILPMLVWQISLALGFSLEEQRVALVFAAGPTAAASYVMAVQMGGDEGLASNAIALSTLLAAPALAAALWLTS